MKYLTFSYDDGVRQDIRLIEIFKRYGMKATFNLNSGMFEDKRELDCKGFKVRRDVVAADEVKDIYSGFEIASHGALHKTFHKLSDEELREEVCGDAEALEKLCGRKVVGAAYPGGDFDSEIPERLRRIGIKYCRTVWDKHGFDFPADFNLWHPTCHDHDERVWELADKFINLETDKDCVFYIWGHAYEFDIKDSDRWYDMEKLCEKLAGRSDICYADNRTCMEGFCSKN